VFIFRVLLHPPTLVFVDARKRHNVITLDRVGNMAQVFTDIPQHMCVFVCVVCFIKALLIESGMSYGSPI
jgi:hypothetical protein